MRWLYLILVVSLVAACGGGGTPGSQGPQEQPPASACPLPDQQKAVSGYMASKYFWHDRLGAADAAAPTMDAYFDSLLYKPVDRYSFTEPTAAYDQRVLQGQRAGYGYTLAWMDAQRTVLRVRNVEPLGPAALAGLRRGDTIDTIDGYTVAEIALGAVPTVNQAGVPRAIVLRTAEGGSRAVNMISAEFPLTIVLPPATFDVVNTAGETVKVGYLAYQSFVARANGELGEAMQGFAQAGIRELVLDLRYNGGGSVNVSRDLASMIGGNKVRDALYAYLRFNPDNVVNNQSVLFRPGAFGLPAPALQTVERLIVLTSPSTASASELVVNGLKPFMPVVLIGGTTYGKPYGSIVQHHCGTTYHAIQFTSLNAQGLADYANGFVPECVVADDLAHELGDPREGRLAAALGYVKTGQCPAVAPLRRPAAKAVLSAPEPIGESLPPVMSLD